MSATTSDWNDAVAEIMDKSGASQEAAEKALHKSNGNVDGAIILLNEKNSSSPKKPPPPKDSGPAFIDDPPSTATFNRQEKRIDDDSVAKSRETPTYAPPLRTRAPAATKASDDINGKTLVCCSLRTHVLIVPFFVRASDIAEEKKKPAMTTASDGQSGHPATLEPCVTTAQGSKDSLQDYDMADEGIPLVKSSSTANNNIAFNTPPTTVRTQLQPRQTQPGAVRVGGMDEENQIDCDNEDIETEATIESGIVDTPPKPAINPVEAQLVDNLDDVENLREQLRQRDEALEQMQRQQGNIVVGQVLHVHSNNW
jgi:hypothetical protein